MFGDLSEVIDFYKTNENKHYHLYNEFEKNVMKDHALLDSFNSISGYGEIPFVWHWKLLVDQCPSEFTFLEIGVYRGRVLSQVGMLATTANKNAKIYGITPLSNEGDKYSNYETIDYLQEITQNFMKLNGNHTNLKIIKGYSQDSIIIKKAWEQGPYNILFIDGCHDYDAVVSDLNHYSNMVVPGGYLVMDDASLYLDDPYGKFLGHPDVSKAAKDVMDNNDDFTHIYAVGHNRVWQRNPNKVIIQY